MEKQIFKHDRSLEKNNPEIEKLENKFGPIGTDYTGPKGKTGFRVVGFSPKKNEIIIKNSSEIYFHKKPDELQKIIEASGYEKALEK